MNFDVKNLSILAYGNGFSLWRYKVPKGETLANVVQPGYINDDMFNIGDHIHVNAEGGGGLLEIEPGQKTVVLAGMEPWRAAPGGLS